MHYLPLSILNYFRISVLVQGFLGVRVYGLHGFGFVRLRKIINIKKIVRFTTRTQICAVFGSA